MSFLIFLDELVFRGAADWTDPIVGQLFKGGSWTDFVFRVAYFRVVNVTTY
jgi:hypothetical protein